MGESKVSVTEGSGKNLRTNDRTISSVLVQEQVVHLAEPYLPTYVVAYAMSAATTESHLVQIMAGSSTYVRILSIDVWQLVKTSGSLVVSALEGRRLTTAGTGGTSLGSRAMDMADSASSASRMALPSSKGTEGELVFYGMLTLTATDGSQGELHWSPPARGKPIIIPSGTANGFALKLGTGATGATVAVQIVYTESAWL